MNEMNEGRCPICDGRGNVPYKLGLVQCIDCGLVISPAIWRVNVNEEMEENWFGEGYEPEASWWVRQFERWNNRRTYRRLSSLPIPGKRLLEIGVGSGSFLQLMQEYGYEVMGCDLSAPICQRVQRQTGAAMHCGPIEALAGNGRFDVVVMNHVLEHVQRPVEFIGEVARLLTPGGVAHIAVPNIDCWEARLPGWTSYEPYHLSYFSRVPLLRAISLAGLERIYVNTHDSFSGWFLANLRTLLWRDKIRSAVTRPTQPPRGQSAQRRNPWVEHAYRIVMVLTGGVLWPLRKAQAFLGKGDELICLARRNPLNSDL